MGEVYRARDTKLNRDVALKILPAAFTVAGDRIARFRREAQVLASLNHPNIATIYGFEDSGSPHALVLELVEGPTLADRIAMGPMSLDEALPIAKQIAEALEAAHERGIIHRDLKPANVKTTPDGQVKVLDFGLARMGADTSGLGSDPMRPAADLLTHSPTLSVMATRAGVILGTAAYMSPEQAQGLPADPRSDVFSFGSVIYEMLTGRQAFRGDSAPAILAAVLIGAPDLLAIPANLNARLVDLVRRCLEKNPKQRWQAVGDLRMELETIVAAPHAGPAVSIVTAPLWKRLIPVGAAILLTGVATSGIWWRLRPEPPAPIVTRFTFTLGDGQVFTNIGRRVVDISPDGTKVVYSANSRLYIRAVGELDAVPIPGSESSTSGVAHPVFSPDGRWIAFFSTSDRALKKISSAGGTAITLCPAGNVFGMSWDASGILFGQSVGQFVTTTGILRVSPNGGRPEQLVTVKQGEVADDPQLLPDHETLLFTLAKGNTREAWDSAQIVAQSLKSGRRTTLI